MSDSLVLQQRLASVDRSRYLAGILAGKHSVERDWREVWIAEVAVAVGEGVTGGLDEQVQAFGRVVG